MSVSEYAGLDCNLLLIAHLICADEQIHIHEARALKSLAHRLKVNQSTQDALEAILSQSSAAPKVDILAHQIQPGQQTETLQQLLAVASIDGYVAPLEEAFIEQIAGFWNIPALEVKRLRLKARKQQYSQSVSNAMEDELSLGARLLQGTESVLSRELINRLSEIAPKGLGRQVRELQREILLAGPEYDSAISKCAEVAQKDYRFAEASLKSVRTVLNHLSGNLQDVLDQLSSSITLSGKAENLNAVVTQLDETRQELNETIFQELENIQASIKARHRNLNHFSIAFMGKTKAGKSTLHAVITGEGWEAIGVGTQRTTRYNRVYEWKNIRIIDTPGIGAPGGKSDEEIAKSIVEEADVICYVVTNDSTQEPELEFLKVLRERTKPVIILLNLKKNLCHPSHLERFLKNPDEIFKEEGKDGISGHIQRFRRYAEDHYPNGYLDVVPVMLLAAQISRKDKSSHHSKQLFRASRLQNFLDSLRLAVVDYGTIRRSQTLLGSTVFSVEAPQVWAREQANIYRELSQFIEKKRESLRKDFEEAIDDIQESLSQKIQQIFADIYASIDAFAIEHWEDSEERLQRAWKDRLKQYELEKHLKTAVSESQRELEIRIKEALEEVGIDLKLLAEFKVGSASFSQATHNFFHKNRELIKLGGLLLIAAPILAIFPPLAALGPVLYSLSAVGTAITLLTSKLKKKETRRSESVQHICQQLSIQLKNHESRVIRLVQEKLEETSQKTIIEIDSYFARLSEGLKRISGCLEVTESDLQKSIDTLNKAYGERILEWATGQRCKVRRVERDFGKQMQIWPSHPVSLLRPLEEISRILQEEIVIH